MLKTPSAVRRAKPFAAAVLTAYAMGAIAAHATVILSNAATPPGGDPAPYIQQVGLLGGNAAQGASKGDPPGVPEPASWALMGIGFAGLGLAAYRAKRRPAFV